MNHGVKRLLSLAAAAALSVSLLATAAGAVTLDLGKTADGLSANNQTNVTLQIPGKETVLSYDVVLCIDKSTSSGQAADLKTQIQTLIDSLSAKKNIQVKLGVIVFARSPEVIQELTDIAGIDFTKIDTALSTTYHGTNTFGGLLKAEAMLSGDTSVPDQNKYLLFASDGINYCWSDPADADTVYTSYYWLGAPNTSTTSLKMHIDAGAYGGQTPTLAQVMSNTQGYENSKDFWFTWDTYTNGGSEAPESICIPASSSSTDAKTMANTMSSVEVGAYLTTNEFQQIAAKYHTITLYWTYNRPNPEYALCSEMMRSFVALGSGYQLTDPTSGYEAAFDQIQNRILYAVDAGSTITDVIGNDFDLTSLDSIGVTIGGVALAGTVDTQNNTVAFGDKSQVVVSYTPGDGSANSEILNVAIHTRVENSAPLYVTYGLKLSAARSAASGTYTLPTNVVATLNYVSTDGSKGSQDFPVPTVSYTVASTDEGDDIVPPTTPATVIPETPTPTTETPTTPTVPTATTPIPEEPVPQAATPVTTAAPQTGDEFVLWALLAASASAGLGLLAVSARKKSSRP